MQQPIQVTFRDIPHSEAVEQHIIEEANKLSQYFDPIISCQIVVELDNKNQNKGKLHNVHIRLSVPGKILATNSNMDENLYLSIRHAFDNSIRQLKDYAERIHGEVKVHPEMVHGTIVRLFEDDGFGFIRNHDGITEYYFNKSNVVNPLFEHLQVGMEVHFIEAMGDEGPQARRVSARKFHE